MRSFKSFSVHSLLITALIAVAPISQALAAAFVKSAVTVSDENGQIKRRIYTEIARGATDAPVVILLNGLIYEIGRWTPVAKELADHDLTVIRMSFSAQPESLRLMEPKETPDFFKGGLELATLSEDVKLVLEHHKIKTPATVVGLSYGAAPATEFAKTFPKRVKNLLLLSPLVVPLDNYNAASLPLRSLLDSIRFWENAPCAMYGWINPWLCSTSDFWYDSFYNYFYENYLNTRVASTPKGVDPAIYKKAVFQLVRATRDYDLKNEVSVLKNIHFAIGEKDEAALKRDQLKAWTLVPAKEKRSFAEFKGVVHALPDEAPKATAWWIESVAREDASLQNGLEYVVEETP